MQALDALEIPDGGGRTNNFCPTWGSSMFGDYGAQNIK
jgi:hypothetical protein